MREIKFRGKRIDNGEWVYGYPVRVVSSLGSGWQMSVPAKDPDDYHKVYPIDRDTLGQYVWCNTSGDFYEDDIFHDPHLENDFTIVFDDIWFCAKSEDWLESLEILDKDSYVVGNIHDKEASE